MAIDFHVFRKPKKTREGKLFYRWYYWFYNEDGLRIQKACPNCKNKSDAESYIRTLPPVAAPGVKNENVLLSQIAEFMYIPGSDHVDRRQQLGKSSAIETLIESRAYVKLIIDEWGNFPLKDIDPEDVMTYLFKVKRSGSWKNRYLTIFKEIYAEAPRHGCKIMTPKFPSFARNSKKADIFTNAELAALFQPRNFPDNQFFLLFLLALSGGLRLGEARGVRYKQIIFEMKILIIDGFCKKNGDRTIYNKMGTPDNPKLRAVWLPDLTLSLLFNFLENKALGPDDFIFTFDEKPIRQETAEMVFLRALINAGIAFDKKQLKAAGVWKAGRVVKKSSIIPGGRKLVPHSLRYTYVSRMRRELSAAELLPMTGHTTAEMVDYYNRKNLQEIINALPRADTALENLLNFETSGEADLNRRSRGPEPRGIAPILPPGNMA